MKVFNNIFKVILGLIVFNIYKHYDEIIIIIIQIHKLSNMLILEKNINYSNHNFYTQTKHIDLSNQIKNKSYFNQMITQTRPKSNQNNTQHGKEEEC